MGWSGEATARDLRACIRLNIGVEVIFITAQEIGKLVRGCSLHARTDHLYGALV